MNAPRASIMNKTVQSFFVQDIILARVHCRHCKGVTEVTLKEMSRIFSGREVKCPLCHQSTFLADNDGINPFELMEAAVAAMANKATRFGVEFVLKSEDDKKPAG